jgi:hypothetical protein
MTTMMKWILRGTISLSLANNGLDALSNAIALDATWWWWSFVFGCYIGMALRVMFRGVE